MARQLAERRRPGGAGRREGLDPSGLVRQRVGSNVSFKPDNGARSEFDLVAGWSGALAPDWSLDANLTRYVYPGTGRALDWTELNTTVTWKQRAWLQVAHSNDALAGGHRGTYAQLGVRVPLHERLRLEAAVGQYWLATAQGRTTCMGSSVPSPR